MSFLRDGRLRDNLKSFLETVGLLNTVNQCRQSIKDLTDPDLRRRKHEHRQLFMQFKRQYGDVLRHNLNGNRHERKTALVCSVHFPEVHIELAIIKALELAGFTPVVLIGTAIFRLPEYYKMAGIKEIHPWSKFIDPPNLAAAEAIIESCQSLQELLSFEYEGMRVGRNAVGSALRKHRLGSLNIQSPQDREILVRAVAAGMSATKAAQRILQKFHPDLVVMTDKGYSPKGELFDKCLDNGVDVISWDLGHKGNSLLLKRFTLENRDQQNNTLSPELWQLICHMEWTCTHREQLHREIRNCYASGNWYPVAGTQRDKRFVAADEIRNRLGLDRQKKTAFIFPHILWDATLFWGASLFSNYEEWLIETVRAACANERVNWVIKIHPAHIGKSLREGVQVEPAEIIALRKHIGELPPHIILIPPESDISTYSLHELMDYCVTVRGSVGIEAAMRGIPALTAGTGSYSHKGFTIDSESREQYLKRLARIETIPSLSPMQLELAERFAYGYFMLRTLPLTTVTMKYHKSFKRHLAEGQINIRSKEEWFEAPDLRAIAQWMTNSSREDFLIPLPEEQESPRL